MKKLLIIISICGLLLTVVPPFFVFFQLISLEMNKNLMMIGTLAWFLTAPYWMNKKSDDQPT